MALETCIVWLQHQSDINVMIKQVESRPRRYLQHFKWRGEGEFRWGGGVAKKRKCKKKKENANADKRKKRGIDISETKRQCSETAWREKDTRQRKSEN